ncbi:Uncharacterized protein BN1224_CV14_A_04790 [Chlamydia pneumoniae]|uniref:Uncharacterized protein n=1 Tax=Chlamydia pneumoniae TaxID=83558 RepID=A0A0F7XGJ0_CHLPN|nr:Uncharacterized protein BN1224_Wien1_A_04760 [Chlamydia pneumoniae]CRI35832.1 Uncharacterized protein BN1224_CM1_A_04790 [Chlamydia pneumoniae]CRI36960.1 Uncharacterized protein BN1224_CV14_A_04790 [Chlamydia pneumoniae]CRI38084.1 Uncharacterized protein BN1224_CV15_B_04070 [Chlamydia pneumoniae]CRI39217.1 Uncharacterized protein BN1224_CWL011_A_04810 [Chlamydia pneumoniae]
MNLFISPAELFFEDSSFFLGHSGFFEGIEGSYCLVVYRGYRGFFS